MFHPMLDGRAMPRRNNTVVGGYESFSTSTVNGVTQSIRQRIDADVSLVSAAQHSSEKTFLIALF